ncbi:MAG: CvpA family protein [Desulfotomaculales bacterium]
MNWVDLLLLLLVLVSCWRGLCQGLVSGLAALVGLVGGFWLACRSYGVIGVQLAAWWPALSRALFWFPVPQTGTAAAKLGLPPGMLNLTLADVLAFVVVFLVTERLAVAMGRVARGMVSTVGLGPLDRIGGLALGLLRAGIIILALAFVLAPLNEGTFLPQALPGLTFLSQALSDSRLLGGAWQLLAALGLHRWPGWHMPWPTV